MIRIDRVSKSYDDGTSHAVADLSLEVAAGEFVVLLGESGCGKTTTLKLINRLIDPSSGCVWVDGENVQSVDPVHLRRGIGYVFQGIGLFPHLSVAANAGMVLNLTGSPPDRARQRTDEVLTQVGLEPETFRDRMPRELSGGQMQRVGVARALAARPRIMLMDEPFGALDPITRSDLQEHFKRLQMELDLTVVMVTHDITEALLLADRVAIMERGRIVAQGSPADLASHPRHAYAEELLASPRRQAARLGRLLEEGGAT